MDKLIEIFTFLDPLARIIMLNRIDEIESLKPIK